MIQKPYQQIGSAFLANRKNAILADEMGLGKTNQAVCAIDLLTIDTQIKRILIVCPAVCRPQWESQLATWLLLHNQHPVQQVEKTTTKIIGKTVMVSYKLVNEPFIFNQLMLIDWDIIIYDEFHYLKNVDAQRTTNILGKDGIITKSNRNWFLSGTPVTGKPANLFPILCTIARKRLHPYTVWLNFIKRFCNAYRDEFGHWKHHGSSNLKELSKILHGVMLRRLAKDVEPDLGEPLLCEALLELPEDKLETYDRETEEIKSIYESTQQRFILANLKGELIYEHLKIVMGTERKVVVFYHHRQLGRYLQARVERNSYKIDGQTPVRKRHKIIKEFVDNKHAVLFAQSDAAGTGVDGIQHGSRTGYFAEMPWNPDVRDQNIKRLLRPGQKGKVKIFIPVIKNTVDEKIFAGLYRKEEIINTILKGN